MKFPILCTILILGITSSAIAGSLYKWIDENGNVVYQDTPPPSDVNYEEQEFEEPERALQQDIVERINAAAQEFPISFYALSECDACDLVRLYLENNAIPFAEKDVEDNVTLQDELKDLTDALRVPTLAIGDSVIDGYSKSAIRQSLIDKGYPIEDIENNGVDLSDVDTEIPVETQSEQEIQDIIDQFEADESLPGLDEDSVSEIQSESG